MSGGTINVGTLEVLLKLRDELSAGMKNATGSSEAFGAVIRNITAGGAVLALAAMTKKLAGAVAELASEAEQWANIAEQTGLGTTQIQQLTAELEDAGIPADALTVGMKKLHREIADGYPQLAKYGITMEALGVAGASQEEQLQAVAQAIGNITDVNVRGAAAQAAFGRSGELLIPVLDDIAESGYKVNAALGEDQVAALLETDEAIDQAARTWTNMKNIVLAGAAEIFNAYKSMSDAAYAFGASLAGRVMDPVTESLEDFDKRLARIIPDSTDLWDTLAHSPAQKEAVRVFREMSKEAEALAEAERMHAEEVRRSDAALAGMAIQIDLAQREMATYLATTVAITYSTYDMARALEAAAAELEIMPEGVVTDLEAIEGELRVLNAELDEMARDRNLGNVLLDTFADSLASLPEVIVGAIQGGGDVYEAIGATIGGDMGTALGAAVEEAIGGRLGSVVGSVFGPLGTLLGQAFGSMVSGIFSDREVMKVNDMRDAFLEAHGGWLQLQKDLASITNQDMVKKIFDAKTVEEFEAATREVMALLDGQAAAQQAVDDAIERYGLTIEELGPKWQQQRLDEMAGQLLQDYEVLKASGADMNAVISKMAPNMSEYVQTALAAGQAIPENMKPIIDQMIEQGLLLDANGEAYKSAEEAGITYTKTLTQGLMEVVEAIKLLVATLSGIPAVTVPPVTYPKSYPPSETGEGYQHGSGWLDFGRGTPVTLHGVERIQTPAQAAGGDSPMLMATLGGIERTLDRMPAMIGRSVRDAVQLRP